MAKIPWKEAGALAPGTYSIEVVKSVEKLSKNGGAPYFEAELLALDFGKTLCFDILMLAGKGAGIGVTKLRALGFTEERDEIAAGELIGRRAFVAVGDDEYDGKVRLKVDINAEGSKCGYWPEDEKPEGVLLPGAPGQTEDVDDTPFLSGPPARSAASLKATLQAKGLPAAIGTEVPAPAASRADPAASHGAIVAAASPFPELLAKFESARHTPALDEAVADVKAHAELLSDQDTAELRKAHQAAKKRIAEFDLEPSHLTDREMEDPG